MTRQIPTSKAGIPPLRELTQIEFAEIGKIVLLWGMHEQHVGTIVGVAHGVSGKSSSPLIHALGYSKKVDLACTALKAEGHLELAKELDHVRRVFRPERDTLAHGAIGMWDKEAWIRSISKERFVLFDDLAALNARAFYAHQLALEALGAVQKFQSSTYRRPTRPKPPENTIPDAWTSSY